QLESAEQAWVERSVRQWARELSKDLKAGDHAGLDRLRKRYERYWADHTRLLENAELEWFERTYQAAPPGQFKAIDAARQQLREGWKQAHEKKLHAWEEVWVGRTVLKAKEDADKVLETNPATASQKLRETASAIKALGDFKAAQAQLLLSRRRALEGVL